MRRGFVAPELPRSLPQAEFILEKVFPRILEGKVRMMLLAIDDVTESP